MYDVHLYTHLFSHRDVVFDNIGVINLEVICLVDWTIPCNVLKFSGNEIDYIEN